MKKNSKSLHLSEQYQRMADLAANLAENAVMEAAAVLHGQFLLDREPLITS